MVSIDASVVEYTLVDAYVTLLMVFNRCHWASVSPINIANKYQRAATMRTFAFL